MKIFGRLARTYGAARGIRSQIPGELQPGGEVEYQEDGRITAAFTTHSDRAALEGFRAPLFMYSRHPEEESAILYNIKRKNLELDKVELAFAYAGLWKNPTDWFPEFQGAIAQEPIETHPRFVSSLGGTPQHPLNKAVFDPETGEFIGWPVDAPLDLGGVSSYYVPSTVVTVSRWQTVPPSEGALQGEIRRPPLFVTDGPNVKDYLVGPVTYRQIAQQLFQVNVSYIGSGARGWNQAIY